MGSSSGGSRLSEPALGSVMPLPSRYVSSARNGLRKRLLLLVGAGGGDQVAPLPALAEGLGDRAVALGEFRHHQRLRHEVDAVPAPFLGHRRGAKAELRALLDDLPVEGFARIVDLVALERNRTYLFLGELARLHLPGALFVAQREVHGRVSLYSAASAAAGRPPIAGERLGDAQLGVAVADRRNAGRSARRARTSAAACRASRPWRRSIRRQSLVAW